MLKILHRSLSSLLIVVISQACIANSFQIFSGTSYDNPANLALVNSLELTAGSTFAFTNVQFKGTVTPLLAPPLATSGKTSSHQPYLLPYFRIAKRINNKFIASLELTTPFLTDVRYPSDSVLRYISTQASLFTYNLSPILAYQITDKLSIAAGFDAQYANATFNQIALVPTARGPVDIPFQNTAASWGYGWHAGLLYHLFKATFIGVSYFSEIDHHLTGSSNFSTAHSNHLKTDFDLPATAGFNLLQFLTPNWLVKFDLYYSIWSDLNSVVLENTALPAGTPAPSFAFNYKNTWRYALSTQYKINQSWSLLAAGSFETTPQNKTDRTPALPNDDKTTLGIGLAYHVTKALTVNAHYFHVFIGKIPINHTSSAMMKVVGQSNVNADGFAVRVSYKL